MSTVIDSILTQWGALGILFAGSFTIIVALWRKIGTIETKCYDDEKAARLALETVRNTYAMEGTRRFEAAIAAITTNAAALDKLSDRLTANKDLIERATTILDQMSRRPQ